MGVDLQWAGMWKHPWSC